MLALRRSALEQLANHCSIYGGGTRPDAASTNDDDDPPKQQQWLGEWSGDKA